MAHPNESKARIMHGTSTGAGGYGKQDIKVVRKSGVKRYVWKRKSAEGKKNPWALAVKKAYAKLKHSGCIEKGEFVPLKRGSALYKEAKRLHRPRSPRRKSKSPKKHRSHRR